MIQLDFIYRTGCHLCEAMWAELEGYRSRPDLEFVSVDILGDKELESRFGEMIPVLLHGEKEICHFFLDPEELDIYLESQVGET